MWTLMVMIMVVSRIVLLWMVLSFVVTVLAVHNMRWHEMMQHS